MQKQGNKCGKKGNQEQKVVKTVNCRPLTMTVTGKKKGVENIGKAQREAKLLKPFLRPW